MTTCTKQSRTFTKPILLSKFFSKDALVLGKGKPQLHHTVRTVGRHEECREETKRNAEWGKNHVKTEDTRNRNENEALANIILRNTLHITRMQSEHMEHRRNAGNVRSCRKNVANQEELQTSDGKIVQPSQAERECTRNAGRLRDAILTCEMLQAERKGTRNGGRKPEGTQLHQRNLKRHAPKKPPYRTYNPNKALAKSL